jgi:hypothetical protein
MSSYNSAAHPSLTQTKLWQDCTEKGRRGDEEVE